MDCWVPELRLTALESITDVGVDERFGGTGVGFPADRWPRDRRGDPAPPLARLRHHPDRLDLGRPGRVLFVFLPTLWYEIQFDDPGMVVVLEPEELDPASSYPGSGALWTEAVVTRWSRTDDGIDELRLPELFDERSWWELPEDVMFAYTDSFKFGGAPFWTGNGPLRSIPNGLRYVGQMPSHYSFEDAPPDPDAIGARLLVQGKDPMTGRYTIVERQEPTATKPNSPPYYVTDESGGGWSAPFANLALDGVGYLFIREGSPPEGHLMISR